MGKGNSQADIVTDWEELLQAVQSNPDLQPVIDAERQSLTQSLTEVQNLKARQNEMAALRQESTQHLQEAVAKGKEMAIKIRSVLRGKVGPKSERLVHFKIAPLRKRPRKAKETAKKPAGGASGVTPDSSAAPSGEGAA
ncbi:MAG: hypothetical protein ACJ76N_19555 [Thermoanaerobaculia bacterium]